MLLLHFARVFSYGKISNLNQTLMFKISLNFVTIRSTITKSLTFIKNEEILRRI